MQEETPQVRGHPVQRKDYDLSKEPRKASVRIDTDFTRADATSPAAIMRQMGFDPNQYMTPLQFLVAVMNDDIDRIYKNEKRLARMKSKGGIALSYRIDAAKTAARYIHMEMPKVSIENGGSEKFGTELAQRIASGQERVRTKRVILETVERISPDIPLPPASYPPSFEIEGQIIEEEPEAEGDTKYNPDTDD